MKDYYKILEVHPEASDEVIQKAYRTLVHKFHPDRFYGSNKQSAVEQMQHINEAYAVLSDPTQRRRYNTSYASYPKPPFKAQALKTEAVSHLRNLLFWAGTGFLVMALLMSGARLFLMTPVGRLLIIVIVGLIIYRWIKYRS